MSARPVAKRQFPCSQCGALQTYAPGTKRIVCPYCAREDAIGDDDVAIREFGLREALDELASAPPAAERITTQCESCAAEFSFDEHVHAGECPFCGTTIVTGTGEQRHIKPRSLLPFKIDERQAREAFRTWLKGLWFAPTTLKNYARGDSRLTGVYVPYWTYDSMTHSSYSGQRGDVYYVRVPYTTVVRGRHVTRTRREARVRWTPVRGTVARFFDDVLVGATKTLPRKITDSLRPWDLAELRPYDERFLSGFRSEVFQVGLDEGFKLATQIMNRVIRTDIARDIGGDRQRIQSVDTRHNRTTFKHVLLPVWSAGFRYRGKVFRFVVNGRTAEVAGQRPYSGFKIAAAAIGGAVLAGGLLYLLERTGVLQQIVSG